MSDTTTIARPYAKAVFEHALDAKKLGEWSVILDDLAMAASDEKAMQFISNPTTTEEQQVELLKTLFANSGSTELATIKELIALLAENKRLAVLPEIKALYEVQRAEQEKTLEVKVKTYSKLSVEQEQHLINSLSQRLQRQVTLDINIDKSLLGGAVIRAGDLVIDGSVRGKLDKLAADLAA